MVRIEKQRLSEEVLRGVQLAPGFVDHAQQAINIRIPSALGEEPLADGGRGTQFAAVRKLSCLLKTWRDRCSATLWPGFLTSYAVLSQGVGRAGL
jgi:hypothetical protein